MATSFMQHTLASNTVSLLGLLVLISSILRQHYSPDSAAKGAAVKAAKLQAMIRNTADWFAILHSRGEMNEETTKELIPIMRSLTNSLTLIDAPEVIPSTETKNPSDQQSSH
jgi:hypothetical protein